MEQQDEPSGVVSTEVIEEVNHLFAGRLRFFIGHWKLLADEKICNDIVGYAIPFKTLPTQVRVPVNPSMTPSEEQAVSNEIHRLLALGAIGNSLSCEGQFVSSIFCVPKSDGRIRLIINLKGLNEFIDSPHYKMEDYRNVCHLIGKDYFMAKIDIQDAYFHIPILLEHRKYLRFYWKEVLYEFNCLPFGLSIAPYAFTKVMRPVLGYLRMRGYVSSAFLDDIILIGKDESSCKENVRVTLELLGKLGFEINAQKCILRPVKELEYLGFVFDTARMCLYLPMRKKQKLKSLCGKFLNENDVSIKEMAMLQGNLISASPAVAYSKTYTRNTAVRINEALVNANKNYDEKMMVTLDVKSDLIWWLRVIDTSEQRIRQDRYDIEITVDSSSFGWGAYCITTNTRAHGSWSIDEAKFHINCLELLAIFNGVRTFCKSHDMDILVRSDNTTAVAYVNRFGGCKSRNLLKIARELWGWCEERDNYIFASYIPGKLNNIADAESRRVISRNDWTLNEDVFKKICDSLGVPTIDYFASEKSTRLPRFVSNSPQPNSVAVDAFTLDWSCEYGYIFPPFCMIPRVLRKIIDDRATCIVVVPEWPTQAWFPMFKTMIISDLLCFDCNKNLLSCPYSLKPHPLYRSLRLLAAVLSPKRLKT